MRLLNLRANLANDAHSGRFTEEFREVRLQVVCRQTQFDETDQVVVDAVLPSIRIGHAQWPFEAMDPAEERQA